MWHILAPSFVAGFVGWMAGEAHGFDRAVKVVDDMPHSGPPPVVDLTMETDGADGILERARR
jgi:hypothetical protein